MAQRRPSKSKSAMIGAPDNDPRTGLPGIGIAIRAAPFYELIK
jgi:hypothetical protein